MDETNQPTAQGTDNTSAPAQNPGLQERINELTAARRQAEEQAQALMKTVAEQSAQLTAVMAQRTAPQVAAPVDALEKYKDQLAPELVEVLRSQGARQEQEFRARMAQLETQQGLFAIQQQAAALPTSVPKEAIARANELFVQAKNAGLNPSSDEALKYSIGEWYMKEAAKTGRVANVPTSAFNAPNANLPSVNPVQRQNAAQAPTDFDSWSNAKQLQYMEQQGVADLPLD